MKHIVYSIIFLQVLFAFDLSAQLLTNSILIDDDIGTISSSIVVENIDNDREKEIIFSTSLDSIFYYDRESDGTFSKKLIEGANAPFTLHDLDQDGDLDMIADARLGRIQFWDNDGFGNFMRDGTGTVGSLTFSTLRGILAFDRLEDEKISIAVYYANEDEVRFYCKTVGGGLGTSGCFSTPNISVPTPFNFFKHDINGDGFEDIILNQLDRYSKITSFENIFVSAFPLIDTNQPTFLSFFDFDNDKDADAFEPRTGNLYINNDEYSLYEFYKTIPLPENVPATSIHYDINEDGFEDIIRVTFDEPFELYINNKNGTFERLILTTSKHKAHNLINSDLDINGIQDLIFLDQNEDGITNSLRCYYNASLSNDFLLNRVSGCNYFDENSNGRRDPGERNNNDILNTIESADPFILSNNDGCYTLFRENGTHTISHVEHPNWTLTTDSSSYTVNIDNSSNANLDFGFAPKSLTLAGSMHAVSGITRCNSDVRFDFTFQNRGTTIITEGTMWITLDSLTQISSTESPIDTMLSDGTIGFKFVNLYPSESITRSIDLSIPGLGGDIEPGTLIEIFSSTEATNTQEFTNFFKHNYSEEIRCAYDPNDKLVSPMRNEEANYTLFGDTLIYTVRFQNTGNDTAFNVMIRDTLDQNLDLRTFNIIGSSHRSELRADIRNERNVTFNFENILLPDSTIDFVGSQGYVTYSIQANDSIPENMEIKNTASIFFDFNPPIVTNTTLNTMVSCFPIETQEIMATINMAETYELPDGIIVDQAGTYNIVIEDEAGCPLEIYLVTLEVLTSTSSLLLQNSILISPNPSTDVFTLDLDVEGLLDYQAIISDPLGQQINTFAINQKKMTVDINQFEEGVYFLQILNQQGNLLGVKKFVVVD